MNFRARNMAVTLLRKRDGSPFTNPGFSRLERHIAQHEKAGDARGGPRDGSTNSGTMFGLCRCPHPVMGCSGCGGVARAV